MGNERQETPRQIEYAGPNGVEVLTLKGYDIEDRPVYGSREWDLIVVRESDGTLTELQGS